MRRHFDSKHPEIVLKLPKEANRHACSCGRTFLEPNRLQEHMEVSFELSTFLYQHIILVGQPQGNRCREDVGWRR